MRELLLHKQNVDRMLGKNEREEEKKRSMTGSNGHAPKRFAETRSRTILCVQRVSGALPLTSRGQFSRRRKLPEKQSGYLFALLAGTIKAGNNYCLPRVCGGVALKGTPY